LALTNYIALLRAVNVGGTGKLPMADLKAICSDAGFIQVQTYIASGNVVFKSNATPPAQRSTFVDLIGSGVGPKQVSWGQAADDCDDRRAGVAIFFSVGA
jgi:hypothetical protein